SLMEKPLGADGACAMTTSGGWWKVSRQTATRPALRLPVPSRARCGRGTGRCAGEIPTPRRQGCLRSRRVEGVGEDVGEGGRALGRGEVEGTDAAEPLGQLDP